MSIITQATKALYDLAVTRSATLDAVPNPTAARTMNAQKITGLANGSAASDAAAFGQVPVVATAAPLPIAYPAAVGVSAKWAAEDHVHDSATPNKDIDVECDFDSPLIFSGSLYTDRGGFWTLTPGTGATTLIGSTNTATCNGSIILARGSLSNSGSVASMWNGGTAGLFIPFAAADAFYWEWVAKTPTAVSDGTNTYLVRLGMGNFYLGAPGSGNYFEWDANTDTHIKTKTAAASAVTAVQTSTIVAGTGYHRLSARKPFGGTTITFAIDGTDQANTGVLNTGVNIAPVAIILGSAGAGADRSLELDYFRFRYSYAANRYA